MRRVLREYIRIARKHGLEHMGQDGREHYIFGCDGRVMARAPGTPRNPSNAICFFEVDCAKAAADKSPMLRRPVIVDGNEAFRRMEEQKI